MAGSELSRTLLSVMMDNRLSQTARMVFAIALAGGTSRNIREALGCDDAKILAAFDELQRANVTLFGQPDEEVRERRRVTVNGVTVTAEEMSKAESIIGFWNDIMGSRLTLRAKQNLRMLIGRVRSYPDVDLTEHALIIASVHEDPHPWWTGKATLNIVYGNDAQFERMRERAQGNYNPNNLTPQQMMQAAGVRKHHHLKVIK